MARVVDAFVDRSPRVCERDLSVNGPKEGVYNAVMAMEGLKQNSGMVEQCS